MEAQLSNLMALGCFDLRYVINTFKSIQTSAQSHALKSSCTSAQTFADACTSETLYILADMLLRAMLWIALGCFISLRAKEELP